MKMLRMEAVESATGYSRASIYRKMNDGSFPKCVKLGDRAIGWPENDISKWLDSRIAAARSEKAAVR